MKLEPIYRSPDAEEQGGEAPVEPVEKSPEGEQQESKVSNEDEQKVNSILSKGETERTPEEKEFLGKFDIKENSLSEDEIKAIETKLEEIANKPQAQWNAEEHAYVKEHGTEEIPDIDPFEAAAELAGVDFTGLQIEGEPNSPEAIAQRFKTIKEKSVNEYIKGFAENYPRAYELAIHLNNGGTEEEFFSVDNRDYDSMQVDKKDVDAQVRIVRMAYEQKGIKSQRIDSLIESLKNDGELFEEARTELEALREERAAKNEAKQKENERKQQEEQQLAVGYLNTIKSKVEKGGKLGSLEIPERDRANFVNFAGKNLFLENGKVVFKEVLSNETLDSQLATLYFMYKKGDLGGLVDRRAATQLVSKYRKKISIVPKGATHNGTQKAVKLGEL